MLVFAVKDFYLLSMPVVCWMTFCLLIGRPFAIPHMFIDLFAISTHKLLQAPGAWVGLCLHSLLLFKKGIYIADCVCVCKLCAFTHAPPKEGHLVVALTLRVL